jgi:hypothetical protein
MAPRAYFSDEPEAPKKRRQRRIDLHAALENAVLEWNRARREKIRQLSRRNELVVRCQKSDGVRYQVCYHQFGMSEKEKWCRFCLAASRRQDAFRAALNRQRSWRAAVMRYADKIDGLKPERRFPRPAGVVTLIPPNELTPVDEQEF